METEMISLVVPVIVICLVLWIYHSIVTPIHMLQVATQNIKNGNLDFEVEVHNQDEIGELSDSLEYMAGELSKLDEYRKNFIANISHDFRSPLTSIKGYLEAMLDGTIPVEKYDRYLNIVLNDFVFCPVECQE